MRLPEYSGITDLSVTTAPGIFRIPNDVEIFSYYPWVEIGIDRSDCMTENNCRLVANVNDFEVCGGTSHDFSLNNMVAAIQFVDEANIDEVFGVDSNIDQNNSNSESGESGDESSVTDNKTEDEPDEENWVIGGREPERLDFTGDHGLNVDLPDDPSFLDYFTSLFPDRLSDDITQQTNKYAKETIAHLLDSNQLPANSRFRSWPKDGMTVSEIKSFLAKIIAMGLVNQESIPDYWSTDEVLSTPFFPGIMSRDRFLNILIFCHQCDNDNYIVCGRAGHNPVYKLGDIYPVVTENFMTVWKPGKNICIDEGMIPFRGRVHFKVYNPDKPDKYGVKSYQLCDSENGFCCRFELYTEASDLPASAKGKTYDLVMRLMQPYLNEGQCLFVDNYYTSPTLFTDLYE